MSYAACIRNISRQQDKPASMDEDEAHGLFSAMLDDGVPDLEMGALLSALRMKGESLSELLGFHRAIGDRLYRLEAPRSGVRPLVVPAYGSTSRIPNLLPLLVLLLQRFEVPTLLHGTLENHGGVAAAYVLRELGIMPCASLAQAQQALDSERIAFVPTAILCPGLASLQSLRGRLGFHNSAHFMVKLLDPFDGESIRMISAGQEDYLARLREFVLVTEGSGLLLRSAEGEGFANPLQRPKLEYLEGGTAEVLFDAEYPAERVLPGLPLMPNVQATAAWIRQVLAGETPLPPPLANQLACCLYAAGYAEDINQAKAIVAVETGSLTAA